MPLLTPCDEPYSTHVLYGQSFIRLRLYYDTITLYQIRHKCSLLRNGIFLHQTFLLHDVHVIHQIKLVRVGYLDAKRITRFKTKRQVIGQSFICNSNMFSLVRDFRSLPNKPQAQPLLLVVVGQS